VSISLRPVTADEFRRFLDVTERAFGSDVREGDVEHELRVFEFDRSLAAFDGDDLVATASIYSLDLTVPGGTLPVAGITFVGVLPSHRRRGILNSIMERQLAEIHDAGREPIAALWASEASIYGRYGYGPAARSLTITVDRSARALRADAPATIGRLRVGIAEDNRKAMEQVYDATRRDRPGFFTRDERWWSLRLDDPENRRHGMSTLSSIVVETDEGPAGYALYRTRLKFTDGSLPDGRVEVSEIVSADAAAHSTLWRTLLDLDLMTSTTARVAADDPLLHLLADPRRARPLQTDNLWVRPVDVAGALSARRYAVPVDVVLDVRDDRCPWNTGRWRVSGDPSGATCEPTIDAADLTLGVEALGAVYLGGTSLSGLAVAGRVEEQTPGAVAAASAAFGWPREPFCPMVF
jgi:predicted acetyltransferase